MLLILTSIGELSFDKTLCHPQEEFRKIMLPGRGLRAKLPPPHVGLLHTPHVPKGVALQAPSMQSNMPAGDNAILWLEFDTMRVDVVL